MEIFNFEQKSPEWYAIRKGKMTASNGTAIGNHKKGLETYVRKIVAEYFSKGTGEDSYISPAMQRGNELEQEARTIYEMETGNTVNEVGFIKYNDFVGCSPDGLVGDEGGVEFKCLNDLSSFDLIVADELTSKYVESDYLWQIQMNLLITGRKWWDYAVYNPNYDKTISIIRVLPIEDMQVELMVGFKMGEQMIKDLMNKYLSKVK